MKAQGKTVKEILLNLPEEVVKAISNNNSISYLVR